MSHLVFFTTLQIENVRNNLSVVKGGGGAGSRRRRRGSPCLQSSSRARPTPAKTFAQTLPQIKSKKYFKNVFFGLTLKKFKGWSSAADLQLTHLGLILLFINRPFPAFFYLILAWVTRRCPG